LLEVLVAILILSVGLLGIAGLQASSLRYSQGGWARAAVASNLADFADRVRTNPNSAATAYVLADTYAVQRTALDAGDVKIPNTASTPPVVDCEAAGANCTPDQLAAMQVAQWRLALNRDMPGAAAFISGASDSGYVVTAIWFDRSNVKADRTTLEPTVTCTGDETDIAARTCCPAAAAAPAGARCTTMVVVP
jgi:type IV pilus assembly protein PilV